MPKRIDTRGRWTIKHADLGPELQALIKKAAERQGQTAGSFVVETLRERAHQILKSEDGLPAHPPPAKLEDVTTELAELVRGMAQTQEQRLAQIERDQATRLDAIRRETRRGRWRR
jgi:hypothetical protein